MAGDELEVDPFELLGVGAETTEAEIKSAYRKLSLKVHPDRNPNNPHAAQKFHELNQAYEILLDPLRRLALTSQLKAKQARKERFAKFDAKRKNLQEELEEREREFKRQRVDKVNEVRKREQENERIKEEGRKLREEREASIRMRFEENVKPDKREERSTADEDEVPALGNLDTTVKVKYLVSDHPDLKSTSSIASKLSQFGAVDESSVVLSLKPSKKAPTKPPKFATALVPFRQIGDAFGAVCASERESSGLRGITILWAEGNEPRIIGWLKAKGMLGSEDRSASTQTTNDGKPDTPDVSGTARFSSPPNKSNSQTGGMPDLSTFSSFPESLSISSTDSPKSSTASSATGVDYESVTLMRLRQAERARLEREIREREAEE